LATILSEDVGANDKYTAVAGALKLSPSDMAVVKNTAKDRGMYDVHVSILQCWRNRASQQATIEALTTALESCGLQGAAGITLYSKV
jgi:hypothetical protein